MALNNIELSALIKNASEGKQSAFKKLLDEYWSYVYGFQIKRTQDEYLAEDITIQTFAKAFDKISTYKSQYNFKTWLISISKNIHIDLIRKENTSISSKITSEEDKRINKIVDENLSPEDEIIKEQNLSSLLEHIKRLKPNYQEMIMLRYFQEMSYKDIALHVNEPINSIKVKLLRARKLLAELLRKSNRELED